MSFLCEGAVGLEGAVEPLARIDASRVCDFLDVGCGVGWALDFGARCLGWRTQGIDPGEPAKEGAAGLGLDIVPRFPSAGSFDLAYASEVIEHVEDPRALIASIRRMLRPHGVFLLRTPNAEALGADRRRAEVDAILCPGWHLVLYTAGSLRKLLHDAGFRVVHTLVEGATVHAAAADEEFGWTPQARMDESLLRRYLSSRASELPTASALRSGLLGTLFARLTRAGHYEDARGVYHLLRAAIMDRHGIDPEAPEVVCRAEAASQARTGTPLPAALGGALHGRGLIALHAQGDRQVAGQFFRAAARAHRMIGDALDPRVDFGVRAALEESELYALATATDEEQSRASLDLLAREGGEADLLALVTTLVALGSFSLADGQADRVDAALFGPHAHDWSPLAIEAAYAISMLFLHHRRDFLTAADRFGRLYQHLHDEHHHGGASGGHDRLWPARLHQAYSWYRAGELARSKVVLDELVGLPADTRPGLAADLRQHARAILAQLEAAG